MPNLTEKRHVAFLNKHTPAPTNKVMGLATDGSQEQIGTDNNNNVKCNVINAVSILPHNSSNGELTPTNSFHVKQIVNYENQTLTGANGLIVYGADNGTSIDMNGYRHLVITIEATATTGLSPLNNLMLYNSLDDTNFVIEYGYIKLYEKPQNLGTYHNTIKIENVGYRYVRLYAHAIQGSPTAYTIKYSRYN